MKDAELKMLADHMGHNINIHTDVYRLQSSLLERAKVASVLIAIDNGTINQFKGRPLQDITVDGITAFFFIALKQHTNSYIASKSFEPLDYMMH